MGREEEQEILTKTIKVRNQIGEFEYCCETGKHNNVLDYASYQMDEVHL